MHSHGTKPLHESMLNYHKLWTSDIHPKAISQLTGRYLSHQSLKSTWKLLIKFHSKWNLAGSSKLMGCYIKQREPVLPLKRSVIFSAAVWSDLSASHPVVVHWSAVPSGWNFQILQPEASVPGNERYKKIGEEWYIMVTFILY